MNKVEKWVKLGIELVLRVSRYGSGLYMRIPDEIARSLGLEKGNLVQVKLVKKGERANPGSRDLLQSHDFPETEEPREREVRAVG